MQAEALDEVIPQWHFRERHSLPVQATVAAVMGSVESVTWREVPLFRMLMKARGLRGAVVDLDHPILDGMTGAGFTILRRADDEIVFGLVVPTAITGRPLVSPAPSDLTGPPPGHLSIAGNFAYDGVRLTTETRVLAGDPASRRRFGLYWLVIRVPSGLIRREWLRATAARATSPYLPPPTA